MIISTNKVTDDTLYFNMTQYTILTPRAKKNNMGQIMKIIGVFSKIAYRTILAYFNINKGSSGQISQY